MLFQRINRSDAEKIFIICQNVSGSTMTAGYSCVFDTGASTDGVRVTQANAGDLQAYAGMADADIANNAYGKVQIYGYRAAGYIYSSAGDSLAGEPFKPIDGEWGVTPFTTTGSLKTFGFLCQAVSSSAASSQYHLSAKVFIRAL